MTKQRKKRGKLTTVGFDADDTLWHNERFFQDTQARFAGLLADHADPDHLAQRLLATEKRNLGRYGYGVKGFTLSMIETAIEVTDQRVPASVIAELLQAGRDMLAHPIELLPHAAEAVRALAETHRVVLITKGDLLDQERKLAQSGLGDLFDAVEIVSEKTAESYREEGIMRRRSAKVLVYSSYQHFSSALSVAPIRAYRASRARFGRAATRADYRSSVSQPVLAPCVWFPGWPERSGLWSQG